MSGNTNMTAKKIKAAQPIVNIPQYVNPWQKVHKKNPNLLSTSIRIDNNVPASYVLKRYKNGTYKFYTYQQNQSSGCYYLVGLQQGVCVNNFEILPNLS